MAIAPSGYPQYMRSTPVFPSRPLLGRFLHFGFYGIGDPSGGDVTLICTLPPQAISPGERVTLLRMRMQNNSGDMLMNGGIDAGQWPALNWLNTLDELLIVGTKAGGVNLKSAFTSMWQENHLGGVAQPTPLYLGEFQVFTGGPTVPRFFGWAASNVDSKYYYVIAWLKIEPAVGAR